MVRREGDGDGGEKEFNWAFSRILLVLVGFLFIESKRVFGGLHFQR